MKPTYPAEDFETATAETETLKPQTPTLFDPEQFIEIVTLADLAAALGIL